MATKTSRVVIQKLRSVADQVVKTIQKGKNPSIDIPLRTLANVKWNEKRFIIEMGNAKQERSFFNVAMAKKFMQTFLVASKCKELLEEDKSASLRELFYMSKGSVAGSKENTFEEQEESDEVVEDLEVCVDALREELKLKADKRGSLVGEIVFSDKGDTIDARRMGTGGWAIPSIVEPEVIEFKKCDAKFVLLVEKAALWERLNEDKFWLKHKCILLTGQGQPPRGVRRLLHRMVNELKLPLYVFVDNDPWGYYIYSVVKQGSINLAYESIRMAVPQAKFIGLSSFDRDKYPFMNEVDIKLNDQDISRAKQLLEYPWFQKKEWQREIRNMLKTGVKFELEALAKKRISFVSEEYLPKKIKDRDFLD